MLPHDWLTAGLSTDGIGRRARPTGATRRHRLLVTVHGDYRTDLLRLAFGREFGVPPVAGAAASVGATAAGACSARAPATTWPPRSVSALRPAT